jgi:hypothetical protein
MAPAIQSTTLPEDRIDPLGRIAHELRVQRFLQPDDVTCGPTCLRKVYDFYGIHAEVEAVIGEIDRNEDGGTLAVFLGMAALRRGLRGRIFGYDLQIFDPTWAALPAHELDARLEGRLPHLRDVQRRRATLAYLDFLRMGGEISVLEELTPALLKNVIDREHPLLVGLSATYLYRFARERWDAATGRLVDDDVGGEPTGHFVVVVGYEHYGRRFSLRDPSEHVPVSEDGRQVVDAQRLINAILLGDATYDAVLLELWPAEHS